MISDPLWLQDFYDLQRVGGPLIDLHVHDAHFIRLLFGMPTGVLSQGRTKGGTVSYCTTQFRFADPSLVVTATSGVIDQQGRPFTHGFEIHLEKATLHYESAFFADQAETMPLKVLTDKGDVVRPKVDGGDPVSAFVAEIKEVLRCVAANQPSPILSGDLAGCDCPGPQAGRIGPQAAAGQDLTRTEPCKPRVWIIAHFSRGAAPVGSLGGSPRFLERRRFSSPGGANETRTADALPPLRGFGPRGHRLPGASAPGYLRPSLRDYASGATSELARWVNVSGPGYADGIL